MRFLLAPSPEAVERSKPPVRVFLAFTLVLVAAAVANRTLQSGLLPAQIESFYLGPGGSEPVGATALWEEVHAGAFLYGALWLMLGSLLAASPVQPRVRGALLAVGVGAALLDLFGPLLLVKAGAPAALRALGFLLASGALVFATAVAWVRYGRNGSRPNA